MDSIFTKEEGYTDRAHAIGKQCDEFIHALAKEHSDVSTRDLQTILNDSVSANMAEIRLKRQVAERTAKRLAKAKEYKITGDALLRCPSCRKEQDDSVKNHCVPGRPDRSQSECIHCYKWFTVIHDGGGKYRVEKGKLK